MSKSRALVKASLSLNVTVVTTTFKFNLVLNSSCIKFASLTSIDVLPVRSLKVLPDNMFDLTLSLN